MELPFPSEEWVKTLCDHLNHDVNFLNSIRDWNIEVLLVGKDLPHGVVQYLSSTYGVDGVTTVGIYFRFNNSCLEARLLINPNVDSYPHAVIADYGTWLRVLRGLNDPVTTMLSVFRRLEIRGSAVTLIRLAANIVSPMARVIMRIPTRIIE